MRLLELSLIAYGAFEGRTLDLSRPGPALHVIYGGNEAGKSTTLRAILGLLYGIEPKSPDAQLLGGPRLRIGATLQDRNGHTLSIVRRKGRQNTLLDEAGEAIDEAPLSRMLQGLSEAQFRLMFGLDHESLRRGGAQLERGRGDLGESLFQAGIGGPSIRDTLQALNDEAEALFTPRGKLRAVNEAIKSYEEARRRVRDHTTRAEAWRENRTALDALREQAEQQQQERQAMMAEQGRLQRTRRVRPKLAKRRELRGRRDALGEVYTLPPDAADQRRKAQREIASSELAIRELRDHVDKLQRRRDALDIPDTLVGVDAELIRELRDRLGNHRKAQQDLPRRRGQLRALEGEANSALRALGRRVRLDQAEALRVDRASEARVLRLAKEHGAVSERCQSAQRQLDDAREAHTRAQAERSALPAPPDAGPLAGALSELRAASGLEERLAQVQHECAALRASTEQRVRVLPRFDGQLDELLAARLPAPQAVEDFAELLRRLAQKLSTLEGESKAATETARSVERALRALEHEGAPPTEEELLQARRARDEALAHARTAAPRARAAALDAFEERLRSADLIADRLRHEAARVGEQARLLAEQAAGEQARDELRQRERALREEQAAAAERWAELWQPAGITPGAPAEMRGFLAQALSLRERAERARELDAEAARLQRRREALAQAAAQALAIAPGAHSLIELAARLEHALRQCEARVQSAERARQRAIELQAEVERATQRHAEAASLLARWQAQWAELMQQLRLPADAAVEEAQAELSARAQLFSKLDETSQMRGRIEGMERDAKAFATDVHRLFDQHLFGLRDRSVEEAADELVQRYEQAKRDLERRRSLDDDLEEASGRLATLARTSERAHQRLSELQAMARAADSEALELAERRAAEAARLDAELAQVDNDLLAEGEGVSLEQLAAEAEQLDPDRIGPRLLDIEQALETLDEEHRGLHHRIGALSHGLQVMESDEKAAEAASEAEAQLSRIKQHARVYVHKRLAAHLLEREIAAYREQNQGPIVRRASELFAKLTLGRYPRLQVGYHAADQPVLQCCDESGSTLAVPALSDGTRDQLYLALRLSSLERFFSHAEPMPLILDDVLIHFDDERARAAFAVLDEFAAHTQVLFFTHHARHLELAREAVAGARLCEHRLNPAPAAARPELRDGG